MVLKISACYIVRDEAHVLERSLESIYRYVDEIIVVDTGSVDQTISVARRYGAKIFLQPWQEDFSLPRNKAIEEAKGDWIVFLDADEFFVGERGQNLREIIVAHKDALGILLKRLEVDQERQNEVFAASFVLRIFRNIPDLRYMGKIHEELRCAGQDMERIALAEPPKLTLMHTGYSASQSRKKAERNLRMLLAELEETEHPERIYGYLADAYLGMDDMRNAVKYARMDIAGGRRSTTYASRSYRILLQIFAVDDSKKSERREAAQKAVADFPEIPEFHAEYAECLAQALLLEQAVLEMEEAFRSFANYGGIEPVEFTDAACQIGKQRIVLWQDMIKRREKIRISACIIVKNEERDLPRWIENAREYSNEIIVVDTGSADGTRELVRQAGIKIYDFIWQNDFSEARNFALERATGDWIVFLDADEYFQFPERIRPFLAETELCHTGIEAIMVPIINIDADQYNQEIHRFVNTRIFRNLPELRYRGRVHESLQRQGGELQLMIEKQRIAVYHTGYSSQRILHKIKRNLVLLQADIAQVGEGPQHYRYLADCYFGLKEYDKTLHYAMLALKAPLKSIGSEGDLYHEIIESMRQLCYPPEEMLSFAEQAIEQFPSLPDFYAEKGMILCGMQRFSESRKAFLKAEQLFENPSAAGIEATYFNGVVDIVYCRLGELCQYEEKWQEALQYAKKALSFNKYNGKALDLCVEAYNDKPDEFMDWLDDIYADTLEDIKYLVAWSGSGGYLVVYFHYAARMQNEFHVQDELEPLYKELGCGHMDQVYNASIEKAAIQAQRLFVSLLTLATQDNQLGDAFIVKAGKLLPMKMDRVMQRYCGRRDQLEMEDIDAYMALLPAIAMHSASMSLMQYTRMAFDFAWDEVFAAAERLYNLEQWAAAMTLYQDIPFDGPLATMDFWHHAGICLYRLRQPELADTFFAKAVEMGCMAPDITAYRQWMGKETGL